MTRPSFLLAKVSLKIPISWEQLTQEQLRYVMKVITLRADEPNAMVRIKSRLLTYFGRFDIVKRVGTSYLCSLKDRRLGKYFLFPTDVMVSVLNVLDWVEHPEEMTIRLEEMDGHHAVDMWLRQLPFGQYLMLENYYQAYITEQDDAQLFRMARILYDVGADESLAESAENALAVFLWYGAIKKRFSTLFPHFLRPVKDVCGDGCADMRTMMNAQIRCLTKGDITKNEQIINTDTWSALTELDALAHEAEEYKQKYGK